ncbi:hypothetical protein BOTBODRAFT_478706 [Botryobasidium botryosum FD-172 SS1]|uniref:Uncharacterized protein n=1 Tax=Botryobasidium botryosum (strain FD-172 SS1) TaxID=930990 RepID=A0A067MTJ8_BOTB1|nr:hypothetical protein BOTBODRAFT_478706 [Botryobasidium botryosum FD-172 SS1]
MKRSRTQTRNKGAHPRGKQAPPEAAQSAAQEAERPSRSSLRVSLLIRATKVTQEYWKRLECAAGFQHAAAVGRVGGEWWRCYAGGGDGVRQCPLRRSYLAFVVHNRVARGGSCAIDLSARFPPLTAKKLAVSFYVCPRRQIRKNTRERSNERWCTPRSHKSPSSVGRERRRRPALRLAIQAPSRQTTLGSRRDSIPPSLCGLAQRD